MDKDLSDDNVKLVRYKIRFGRCDYEHGFREETVLVWDASMALFAARKVAEFLQSLRTRDSPGSTFWLQPKTACAVSAPIT
jgi:hypothetical protein